MGALVHKGFSDHVEDISVIINMEEGIPPIERHLLVKRLPDAVKTKAYKFYGNGNYDAKEWDLAECRESEFCWYQVQLPKGDQSQLSKYLIDVLGPLLKRRDILSLIKSGRFCGHVDDAVIFRVTSVDPASTSFTFKLAVRVTGNAVISVFQDRAPMLGFSSFKKEEPILEPPNGQQQGESSGFAISEPTLQSFVIEEADYRVPRSVSNLVIHIIETNVVAPIEDVVDKLETDLDALELDINAGDSERKQLLQGSAELLTKSQRILQVIAHGEQELPQVKGKCSSKEWLADAVCNLEELIGLLRGLKENVKIISKRAKAIQTGLQVWQSNQINRKLYYIALATMASLPLSLLTSVFGMSVGGIPWKSQKGFRNVMLLCASLVIAMLVCYGFLKLRSRLLGRIQVERLRNWRPFLRRPMAEPRPQSSTYRY